MEGSRGADGQVIFEGQAAAVYAAAMGVQEEEEEEEGEGGVWRERGEERPLSAVAAEWTPAACEDLEAPPGGESVAEFWARRRKQRQLQVDLGKATEGYANYLEAVPPEMREPGNPCHPLTPRVDTQHSKRTWDSDVRNWRRALHIYDEKNMSAERLRGKQEAFLTMEGFRGKSRRTKNVMGTESGKGKHRNAFPAAPAMVQWPQVPYQSPEINQLNTMLAAQTQANSYAQLMRQCGVDAVSTFKTKGLLRKYMEFQMPVWAAVADLRGPMGFNNLYVLYDLEFIAVLQGMQDCIHEQLREHEEEERELGHVDSKNAE